MVDFRLLHFELSVYLLQVVSALQVLLFHQLGENGSHQIMLELLDRLSSFSIPLHNRIDCH